MPNFDRKESRLRRASKTRARIRTLQDKVRLCVNKTPKHIYASLISPQGDKTIATVSTVQKTMKEGLGYTGNVPAAEKVGAAIAEAAKKHGINEVAFDRSGFKYHGRVKALAEAARKGGLKF